jgi:hypothetical protein
VGSRSVLVGGGLIGQLLRRFINHTGTVDDGRNTFHFIAVKMSPNKTFTPVSTEKKVPPRHQSLYRKSCLVVDLSGAS